MEAPTAPNVSKKRLTKPRAALFGCGFANDEAHDPPSPQRQRITLKVLCSLGRVR